MATRLQSGIVLPFRLWAAIVSVLSMSHWPAPAFAVERVAGDNGGQIGS
jgi:hypothetical protein